MTLNSADNKFVRIETEDQLEQLIGKSHRSPVFLLKHSSRCGTSWAVYQAVQEFRERWPGSDNLTFGIVWVVENRSISVQMERRFAIKHESPQLLVLIDGNVIWHGSHLDVSPAQMERIAKNIPIHYRSILTK